MNYFDTNIQVVGCYNGNDLEVQNSIKIFSLDYIKGLEFDVVFLMDFDNMFIEKLNESSNLIVEF